MNRTELESIESKHAIECLELILDPSAHLRREFSTAYIPFAVSLGVPSNRRARCRKVSSRLVFFFL
jgi:hypothetical protein